MNVLHPVALRRTVTYTPMDDMTHNEYATVREKIGSQKDVARMLGVDIRTVQRRECGDIIITDEAVRALLSLTARSHIERLLGKLSAGEKFDLGGELNRLIGLLTSN